MTGNIFLEGPAGFGPSKTMPRYFWISVLITTASGPAYRSGSDIGAIASGAAMAGRFVLQFREAPPKLFRRQQALVLDQVPESIPAGHVAMHFH